MDTRISDKGASLWVRLIRGAVAQGCSQVVRIFLHFVEVPLFLHFWGIQLYGEWLILTALPAYLTLSDVGFANAARRDMAMLVACGDRQGALGVFQSIGLVIALLSIAIFLASLGLIVLLPFDKLFHLKLIDPATIGVLLVILCLYVLFSLQSGVIYSGFYCEGFYGFGTFLGTLIRLLEFALLVIALVLGGTPIEAALALLIGRFLGFTGVTFMLKRTVSWVRYGVSYASWSIVKRLTRPAFASMAFPMGNALNSQGIRLVIGATLGPAAIAIFATLRTLSRATVQAFGSISLIVEPELGRAFGRGDRDLFRRLFRRACQLTLWVAGLGCLTLWLVRDQLVQVWTAGKIPMDDTVFALLLLIGLLNSCWFTAMKVANATNRHGKIAVVYSLAYSMSVLAAYIIAPIYGLSGVCAVLLVTEVALAAYVLPQSFHLADDWWLPWARTVVQPPYFLFAASRKGVLNLLNKWRNGNTKLGRSSW
jgi:O-antigen/teichoic acid export membrane protein